MASLFFPLPEIRLLAFMRLCAADGADCCLWPCGKHHVGVWNSRGLCENNGSGGLLRGFKADVRLLA